MCIVDLIVDSGNFSPLFHFKSPGATRPLHNLKRQTIQTIYRIIHIRSYPHSGIAARRAWNGRAAHGHSEASEAVSWAKTVAHEARTKATGDDRLLYKHFIYAVYIMQLAPQISHILQLEEQIKILVVERPTVFKLKTEMQRQEASRTLGLQRSAFPQVKRGCKTTQLIDHSSFPMG